MHSFFSLILNGLACLSKEICLLKLLKLYPFSMIIPTTRIHYLSGKQLLTDLKRAMGETLSHLYLYKVAYISLFFFFVFTLRILYPQTFTFGFKQKSYKFKTESLGFFVGDMNFLDGSIEEAEQKMVELFPPNLQKKVAKIIRPVLVLCEKHQLDPFWVLSVMWTESHFRVEALSHKGAAGLMQVMPETFLETLQLMKRKGIRLEAEKSDEYFRLKYGQLYYQTGHTRMVSKLRNLEVGIYYLKGLLQSFANNHHYATVAYNMGPYWTSSRLKNNLPVGINNQYLNKVKKAYSHITQELSTNNNVTFIPNI